jgi:hypothetical protein
VDRVVEVRDRTLACGSSDVHISLTKAVEATPSRLQTLQKPETSRGRDSLVRETNTKLADTEEVIHSNTQILPVQ